ncbi:adenylate kinase [Reticulomyxa filosa]|uniref:Adenylate kinase n=1 Tax=Reticulomyxa filosa TaxID=46433 RepID=X6N2K1_RETFI|nr:adenylate kinase [Reticulomyxa filosa]|eukprot:ETO19954.1 adenylate kinase [Reticulomyxa filosa]
MCICIYRKVKQIGIGKEHHIRETDVSEEKARYRYGQFHSQVYHSLQLIQKKFPFHFINAEGSPDEVKRSIETELAYQSRTELADATFDNVRRIPLAGEIKKDARLELVKRLDGYEKFHKVFFDEIIRLVIRDFIPVIKQQALTVILRSENPLLFEKEGMGLRMVLDLLSERGYRVTLDYLKERYPDKIDLHTGLITCHVVKIVVFHIAFPPPKIRHATAESIDGWDTHIV